MAMGKSELSAHVAAELTRVFPHWATPEHGPEHGPKHSLVIREKYATFACRPSINTLRPGAATPVRSGVECARRILADD